MKQFKLHHPLYMSFYSNDLYRDVAKNWGGVCATYLLLLLAIVWLPLAFQMTHFVQDFKANEAPKLIEQLPTLSIESGEASIDKAVPYIIKDPETEQAIAIIDTSDQITSLQGTDARVLITKTQVMTRNDRGEQKIYELAGFPDVVLDKEEAQNILNSMGKWLMVMLFPFAVALSFLYRFVQALIYAAIGMVFVYITKAPLIYQQMVRIAIIAVTPVVIIGSLFSLLGLHFIFQHLLYFIITMVYLYRGVKANHTRPM